MNGSNDNLDNKPRSMGATKGASMGGMSGTIGVVVVLLAILAGSIWLMAHTWIATDDVSMNVHGYVAMILGIVFSLVVGCGLMALVFYSSRHGYDDPHGPQNPR